MSGSNEFTEARSIDVRKGAAIGKEIASISVTGLGNIASR